MTNTSIRAELRRAAADDCPWHVLSSVAENVVLAFLTFNELGVRMEFEHEHARWLILLVAEAL